MADLDAMLRYLDTVADLANQREVPAYAETCSCGGSITVSKDIQPPERRRFHAQFIGRHRSCTAGTDAGDEQ